MTKGPHMKHTAKVALLMAVFAFAVFPLFSQTTPNQKPSFDVISIKPSPPGNGPRGGGPRGDRFTMTGVTLRTLLQTAYQRDGVKMKRSEDQAPINPPGNPPALCGPPLPEFTPPPAGQKPKEN